jgi:cold shock CspA family protein
MTTPIEISHRGIDDQDTGAVDDRIRGLVAGKLEPVCSQMQSCRVAVERPNRHPRSGSGYRVRVDVTVPPAHEIAVTREPHQGSIHDDLDRVLLDAFGAARRRLKRLNETQQGRVKTHDEQQAIAVVRKLMDGYGFIETGNGREVYFHANSVLDTDFEDLDEGMTVHYTEETGAEGPQASTVRVVDRRSR